MDQTEDDAMRVKPVTSPTCEVCKMYEDDSDILEQLRTTISPLRNVQWSPESIQLEDSVEVDDDPWPALRRKSDKISPNLVFTRPIQNLEKYAEMAGEELFTPAIFLLDGSRHDPDYVEMIDLSKYEDKVLSIPWSVSRSCMSTIFGFYLYHELSMTRSEADKLWSEQTSGNPLGLEPQHDYGKFQSVKWQQAFRRAERVEE